MSWLLLTFWVYCLPRSFLDITFKTYWIPQSSQKPRYSLPLSIPHPALGLCTSFPLSWMSFTSPGNAWIPVLPQVTYLIPQYLSLPVSKAVCKSHLACGSCQCIAMIVHKFFSFSGTRALEEGAFVSEIRCSINIYWRNEQTNLLLWKSWHYLEKWKSTQIALWESPLSIWFLL